MCDPQISSISHKYFIPAKKRYLMFLMKNGMMHVEWQPIKFEEHNWIE